MLASPASSPLMASCPPLPRNHLLSTLQNTSDESLANLAATGASHVRILVTWFQDTINSTQLYRANGSTPLRTSSDADLNHVLAKAHALGLRTFLVILAGYAERLREPLCAVRFSPCQNCVRRLMATVLRP